MDGTKLPRYCGFFVISLFLILPNTSSAQLDSTAVRSAPTNVLFIYGSAAHAVAVTPALVLSMPHVQVKVLNSTTGKTEKYAGVPLKDLLARAGVAAAASITLAAVSQDGSKSVLSIAATEAAFQDGSQVIVADTANEKLLDTSNGPLMLIVSGGTGPTLRVPNLARIQVNTAK